MIQSHRVGGPEILGEIATASTPASTTFSGLNARSERRLSSKTTTLLTETVWTIVDKIREEVKGEGSWGILKYRSE